METTNDSGIVGDNVTNNTRPTFTGKTEPNAIISVINSETGEEVIFKANDKANGRSISLPTQWKGLTILRSLLKMSLATKRIFPLVTLSILLPLYSDGFFGGLCCFYRMV
ncbi:Ig-like domain-containing protein [Salmonella enterica]|uniref:Ig-like domain-containing protein n=1 Tax=Salmonella enterica TaxID=28901 RepID=UPI003299B06A